MQSIYLTISFIFFFLSFSNNISASEACINSLYQTKKNILDNEKSENIYKKIKLKIDNYNSFSAAMLYNKINNEKKYTWNIALHEKSSRTGIIIGYFNINFGSGLSLANTDNTFGSSNNKTSETFYKYTHSASTTSNHFGVGLRKEFNILKNTFFIYSFLLRDQRYTNHDKNPKMITSSSISTIFNRTERSYNNFTPVNLFSYGTACQFYINQYLSFATLMFQTKLTDYENNILSWNHEQMNKNYTSSNKITLFSYYMNYNDKFLKLFYEASCSQTHMQSDKNEKKINAYATQTGFSLKHHKFKSLLKYKHNQSAFSAPFSSQIGSNYSDQALITENSLILNNYFSISNQLKTQKKFKPSSSYPDEMIKFNEKYSIIIKKDQYLTFNISCQKKQNLTNLTTKRSANSSLRFRFNKDSFINLSAKIQKNKLNHYSKYIHPTFQIKTASYHTFKFDLAYLKIKEKNSVTINISRPHKPGSIKFYISETSFLLANHYSLKKKSLCLNFSIYNQFYKKRTYFTSIELNTTYIF